MRAVAKILRAGASEHSSNFCEQFEQRPNFASTFKFSETIRYPYYWSHTRLFKSPSIFQSPSFRFYSFCSKMSCFDVTAWLVSVSRLIDWLIAIVALSEQSMVGEDIENVRCVALLCNWFLIQVWIKQERIITFLYLAASGSSKRWVQIVGHVITWCLASFIVICRMFIVTVAISIGVMLARATSHLALVS